MKKHLKAVSCQIKAYNNSNDPQMLYANKSLGLAKKVGIIICMLLIGG